MVAVLKGIKWVLMDKNLAATYTLIYAFLLKQNHPKAARALQNAVKNGLVLKEDAIDADGPSLSDIVNFWTANSKMNTKSSSSNSSSSTSSDSSSTSSDSSDSESLSARAQPCLPKLIAAPAGQAEEGRSGDKSPPKSIPKRKKGTKSSSSSSSASSSSSSPSDSDSDSDSTSDTPIMPKSNGSFNGKPPSASAGIPGFSGAKTKMKINIKADTKTETEIKYKVEDPSFDSESESDSESSPQPKRADSKLVNRNDSVTDAVQKKWKKWETPQEGKKKKKDQETKQERKAKQASSESGSSSSQEDKDKTEPSSPESREEGQAMRCSSPSASSSSILSENDKLAADPAASGKTKPKLIVNGVEKNAQPAGVSGRPTKKRKTSEDGAAVATATAHPSHGEQKQRVGGSNEKPPRTNGRFMRVDPDKFRAHVVGENRYDAKTGPSNDYGERAHRDLIVTRGAGFRKEKGKKKRGSYRGGEITMESHSFKFTD